MAANQSRRRSGPGQASEIDIPLLGKSTADFQYQPLDPSTDCTRLVEFEPAEDASEAPHCKLIHVTFGERPKYEALSYMWGDETLKKKMFVDEKEFLVGRNLWDALHYLRKRGNGLRYWIDAICINQADIPERNRQLRIMPHIYWRAQTVLVWLGRKYAKYDMNLWPVDARKNRHFNNRRPLSLERLDEITDELCSDDYWNRVWIVQEIGKARKIQVCLGEREMAWDVFIQRCDGQIPEELERQRKQRYDGGHTLQNLLENHQDAVCKDPRDKIYGFVGLATDARGFLMDYQKSLFEVWKDTMLFANKHNLLNGSGMIRFGRLVKHLLGGSSVATTDQVFQEYDSGTCSSLSTNDDNIIRLPAYIAGAIVCKGPSPEQMLSVLDVEDEWRARIRQNFPLDLGDAYGDSDLLMQALLDSESPAAAASSVLSFPDPRIRWKSPSGFGPALELLQRESRISEGQDTWEVFAAQQAKAHDAEETKPSVPASESCLYQIRRINGQSSKWKMGIAVGGAQIGDLICCIEEIGEAVIVRMDGDWLQIIGTATVPKDLDGQRTNRECARYFDSDDEECELYVDVETAYILTSWEPARGSAWDDNQYQDDEIFNE